MDTGLAFQEHAELSLNNIVEKYFHNAVSGHVTLEKADSGFTVKTRVALSRRIELESTGRAPDAHAALDAAIEHAEKRLRRHKRRLKNHRIALTNLEEDDIDIAPMAVYAGVSQLPDSSSVEDDLLPIVAELSYDIEVALAGYGKKDITVNYEDNVLKIESVKSKEEKEVEDNDGVLHKGIAKRSFVKSFTIADDVEVKGAELKDGLLKVSLMKIVPDHKKARTITIK